MSLNKEETITTIDQQNSTNNLVEESSLTNTEKTKSGDEFIQTGIFGTDSYKISLKNNEEKNNPFGPMPSAGFLFGGAPTPYTIPPSPIRETIPFGIIPIQNTKENSFGNSTAAALFGPAPTAGCLFGQTQAAVGGALFGNSQAVAGGGLFGNSQAVAGGGLFGNSQAAVGGALFGNSQAVGGGALFGNSQAAVGGGLFGNINQHNSFGYQQRIPPFIYDGFSVKVMNYANNIKYYEHTDLLKEIRDLRRDMRILEREREGYLDKIEYLNKFEEKNRILILKNDNLEAENDNLRDEVAILKSKLSSN